MRDGLQYALGLTQAARAGERVGQRRRRHRGVHGGVDSGAAYANRVVDLLTAAARSPAAVRVARLVRIECLRHPVGEQRVHLAVGESVQGKP